MTTTTDAGRVIRMTRTMRLLLVGMIAMGIPLAASAIDQQIGYEGFLTNNLGSAPITDGSYSIIFSIYTLASGGVALWTETQTVNTVTGEFSVKLGSVTPLSVDFTGNTNYYLGIKVGANPEMSPRKQLLYTPFAFRSDVETRSSDPVSPVNGQMWLIVP
jgi:hypothetical protein